MYCTVGTVGTAWGQVASRARPEQAGPGQGRVEMPAVDRGRSVRRGKSRLGGGRFGSIGIAGDPSSLD